MFSALDAVVCLVLEPEEVIRMQFGLYLFCICKQFKLFSMECIYSGKGVGGMGGDLLYCMALQEQPSYISLVGNMAVAISRANNAKFQLGRGGN